MIISVNFPIVTGGFALLAASGVAAISLGPVLAGLGLVGTGVAGVGVMMAMQQCGGPVMCVAPTGQCCFLAVTTRGFVCPLSC